MKRNCREATTNLEEIKSPQQQQDSGETRRQEVVERKPSNMDDTQRIVKCGNLSLHTPGSFFKKRWPTKYLVLYDGSKSGVKRLELFESEIKFKKQSAVKIIPLVDCVRIVTCQRHKSTFTFEVRTSDQFYLLASKSFQDMNDWVNCLRFVAFGQAQANVGQTPGVASVASGAPSLSSNGSQATGPAASSAAATNKRIGQAAGATRDGRPIDVLLERRSLDTRAQRVSALSNGALPTATSDATSSRLQMARKGELAEPTPEHSSQQAQVSTASQAATAAANALAKTRQRQPSLLGSCKPLPPNDSPFIKEPQQDPLKSLSISLALVDKRLPTTSSMSNLNGESAGMDTLTPTVRGQLIATGKQVAADTSISLPNVSQRLTSPMQASKRLVIETTLDEEEENMLYCSIEDNPSEHNYRVKVIETELALRCQLKCYQLTAPKTISQQYEELSQFRADSTNPIQQQHNLQQREAHDQLAPLVTFYQLIIGPQELTLLNDYAASYSAHKSKQQQGLWSWPYQCIRRYGFDKDNCFMFEAGRKCGSGPGQFIVQTPKAYNIYQDVVKFVNELRTINGTVVSGNPASGTAPCVQAPVDNSLTLATAAAAIGQQAVVTQIPVTWAPSNPPGANHTTSSTKSSHGQQAEVVSERRKQQEQFFNRLSHQVDASAINNQQQQQAGANCHSNVHLQIGAPVRVDGAGNAHDLLGEPITNNDETHFPNNRLAAVSLSSPSTPRANQKADQNSSLLASSRLSSASEETDESGYDQGDESVESGPTKSASSESQTKQAPVENQVNVTSRLASRASGKLTVQPDSSGFPTSSSNSISCSLSPSSNSPSSSSSSAANSPGQSVSRRTGETIQLEADRQQSANQLLIDARLSLNKVGNLNGLTEKTRTIRDIIATTDEQQQQQQQPIDFEASLIRDVYSEITKLHAKFAVTSSGSGGDDSLSNHSRESSGAVSDRLSNQDEEDEDEDEDEDDQSEEESNADDGCYYMNNDSVSDEQDEPMYSNLSPQVPTHRSGVVPPKHRKARRQQPTTISTPDKRPKVSTNVAAPITQQSQVGHRAQQMLNTRANSNILSYNPPLSPQPSRPIYPTILVPIPEINEPSQSPRHGLSKATSISNMESKVKKDQRAGNISARARLALDRDAIKTRQHYRPAAGTSNGQPNTRSQRSGGHTSKPTNHYVINNVQYAKISRSPSASRFR